MNESVKTVWIARNRNNDLWEYKNRPTRLEDRFRCSPYDETRAIQLDSSLYPEITFENSPQKVKIISFGIIITDDFSKTIVVVNKEDQEEIDDARILLYKDTVDTFGIESQIRMIMEETGEMLSALGKYSRGRSSVSDIITELADVSIMVEQMAVYFGLKQFKQEKEKKLLRLEEKLEKEKKEIK